MSPEVRFYRTPRLERMWNEGDWFGMEKETAAIQRYAEAGLIRPWFEDHGETPPWFSLPSVSSGDEITPDLSQ